MRSTLTGRSTINTSVWYRQRVSNMCAQITSLVGNPYYYLRKAKCLPLFAETLGHGGVRIWVCTCICVHMYVCVYLFGIFPRSMPCSNGSYRFVSYWKLCASYRTKSIHERFNTAPITSQLPVQNWSPHPHSILMMPKRKYDFIRWITYYWSALLKTTLSATPSWPLAMDINGEETRVQIKKWKEKYSSENIKA